MVSQTIMIGIAVGVFFAGLGVGYAVLQSTAPATPMMMNSPQMRQMMNDPQMVNQWHQQMASDPQLMNQWMNTMMQNPQHMNQWMGTMMNDPQTMQQMHSMMMSNPQFMNSWMSNMMQNPNFQQQYMGPWMMMKDPRFMQNMRGQWSPQSSLEQSAVETNKVSILANTWQYQSTEAFSPPVIEVSRGTTVTWTNDDAIIHTVTELGGKFNSGFIDSGETWDYTFDAKGTYDYFCTIHPWMKGTAIVS